MVHIVEARPEIDSYIQTDFLHTCDRDIQTNHVCLSVQEAQTGPDWIVNADTQTEEVLLADTAIQTLSPSVASLHMQTDPPPIAIDQNIQAATMAEALVTPGVLFEEKGGVYSFKLAH